jgi:hypothetical protein
MKNHIRDYIGDGVYVAFDGFSIWLYANDPDNPTDQICLEPSVLEALNRFADRMTHECATQGKLDESQ